MLASSERRMDLSQRKQSMYLPVIESLSVKEAYYGGGGGGGGDHMNNPGMQQPNSNHRNNQNSYKNTNYNNNNNNNNYNNNNSTTTYTDDGNDDDNDNDDHGPFDDPDAWQAHSPLLFEGEGEYPQDPPYDRSPPTSADTGTGARAVSSGARARAGEGGARVATTEGSQLHHYLNQVTHRVIDLT